MSEKLTYIVVNWDSGPSRHPYKHMTLRDAKEEAKRLARINPGVEFHVMVSLGHAIKKDVHWSNSKVGDNLEWPDEIPF